MEGKVLCAAWARKNRKPILGVCLGFQCMVIEYCRTELGWDGANSTEFDEATPHPCVIFMPEGSKDGACEFICIVDEPLLTCMCLRVDTQLWVELCASEHARPCSSL